MSDLERISGVSLSTIRRIYHNESKSVDLEVLAKICLSLNCGIEELLVIEEVEESESKAE